MELELLKKAIFSVHPLSDEEWQQFAGCWKVVNHKRKTILTSAGQIEKHLYFVLDGAQRAYYSNDESKEVTIVFTYPYSFSGVADSFLTQQPSGYFLETITKSTFLQTSYSQVLELMNTYHNFERWVRIATANALRGVLERQAELVSFSAEQKFKALLNRSPHVLQIIPHKYLASYLGLDPSTFSKLLGSVKL